jgi:hypothetical protein
VPVTGDRNRPDYWQSIKVGDIITLKDEQTLELLMKGNRPGFARGVDLTVQRVRRIVEQKDLMKWTVYELEKLRVPGGEETWYLALKEVDDAFDLRLMFVPPDFTPGSRADLLAAGCRWLFQAPPDENNFRPGELEYTETIEQTVEGRVVVYRRKPQGLLFGAMTEEPKPSGLEEPQFVAVLEYRAEGETENPELLVLEIGGVRADDRPGTPDEGGFVVLLQGTNVSTSDVERMTT